MNSDTNVVEYSMLGLIVLEMYKSDTTNLWYIWQSARVGVSSYVKSSPAEIGVVVNYI